MPVLVNLRSPEHHLSTRQGGKGATLALREDTQHVDCINIGLINNMPDSALMPTERQLFDLLNAAAGKLIVRLHLYSMETTPRTTWGLDYVRRFYLGTHDLFESNLDGIIVTGAEPRADHLTKEPYWAEFAEVIDWAKESTLSSVYSCLAVHGAVLHLDGIERRALPEKCIGVFNQTKTMKHPLMRGIQGPLSVPHSRWNEVREPDLAESGYNILTRSKSAGVDCFVKQQQRSLFVCFQGHPEYEAQSLLGEYRRDIGRFLRGEQESYPTLPQGYFNKFSEQALIAFQHEALSSRRLELLASLPVDQLARDLRNKWHAAAKRIYRNWILYLSSQKIRPPRPLNVSNFSRPRLQGQPPG
jgi:homoserine O-succinyltransferase